MYRVRSNRWLDSFTILPPLGVRSLLGWSHIAHADAVLDWNAIAADTVSKAAPPRPVPVSFLDMAVVQAAVYDAVEAIGGKFKPYQVQISGASGSAEAAAAKAAHDVLINIFQPQARPARCSREIASIDDPAVEAVLSRNRKAAQRRGWSHGGEPLSLTTWPGCARRPPFRQRTSPETETRKAEPANKSLIDRRLSAPSPTLCSQLPLRETDPLSVGTLGRCLVP